MFFLLLLGFEWLRNEIFEQKTKFGPSTDSDQIKILVTKILTSNNSSD